MMLAALDDEAGVAEIVELDDGFVNANVTGPALYFAPFRCWPAHHRQAMRLVRARVLDVGAGAGRASLRLRSAATRSSQSTTRRAPSKCAAAAAFAMRGPRLRRRRRVTRSLRHDRDARKQLRHLRQPGAGEAPSTPTPSIDERRGAHLGRVARRVESRRRRRAVARRVPAAQRRARPAARSDPDPQPLPHARQALVRLPDGVARRAPSDSRRKRLATRADNRLRRHVRCRHREGGSSPSCSKRDASDGRRRHIPRIGSPTSAIRARIVSSVNASGSTAATSSH
jgi:hypothetical protein